RAWPKLPLEAAMMCCSGTAAARWLAARNLKLPVCWNVSQAMVSATPSRRARRAGSMMVVGRMAGPACGGIGQRSEVRNQGSSTRPDGDKMVPLIKIQANHRLKGAHDLLRELRAAFASAKGATIITDFRQDMAGVAM